ncbi:MAG: polysaccharide deacetylase family protein [Clostridiales bacterium]|nr:polysaccharide deacetylase family protein [Clostridiales bacterium]
MVIKISWRNLLLSLAVLAGLLVFTFGGIFVHSVRANSQPQSGMPVPIIMYHSIIKDYKYSDKYIISLRQLENDLRYIKERGYTTITMSQLIAYAEGNNGLPEKPIIITFDDGYYNGYVYLYPLLQELGMKAIISVVGSFSDANNPKEKPNPNYSYLTWEQMKEMMDSGVVEIQNHSYNMHSNKGKRLGAGKRKNESFADYEKALTEDTIRFQDMCKEKLGWEPNTYVYPFGAFGKESEEILAKLGFKATLSCYEKVNYIDEGSSLFSLRRYNRAGGKGSEAFFKGILE